MAPNLLKLYNQYSKYPFGKHLVSLFFGLYAPYFLNLRALILDARPGFGSIKINQRWALQNHIKTVHAIAVCNLIEMTMGLTTEVTIPSHLRWIPKGMDVNYLKKATGTLIATCNIDKDNFFKLNNYPGEVQLPIDVKNKDNEIVTSAIVRLWITEKK